MKYIKPFNLLTERKNYGKLYHFSSLINIYKILTSNKLYGTEAWFSHKNPSVEDNIFVISLTRNKSLYKTHKEFSSAALVLDGEKLTDRYVVKPHDFFHFEYGIKHSKKNPAYEYEETIILPKGKDILNDVDKFLEDVILPTFDEFMEHFNEYMGGVDFDTQIERVIDIVRELNPNYKLLSIGILDRNEEEYNKFMKDAYDLICTYINEWLIRN